MNDLIAVVIHCYLETSLSGLAETGVVDSLDAAHVSGQRFVQGHQPQLKPMNGK